MKLPDIFLSRPIAHRGLHDRQDGRPENSRAAMQAAVEQGYGIELDIQPSSDGVPMVFHDPTLARLTGEEGRVRDRTAARNLAILRKVAINLMGLDRTNRISMRARRKQAAWNDEYMRALLAG